jgi:hypothetical protein
VKQSYSVQLPSKWRQRKLVPNTKLYFQILCDLLRNTELWCMHTFLRSCKRQNKLKAVTSSNGRGLHFITTPSNSRMTDNAKIMLAPWKPINSYSILIVSIKNRQREVRCIFLGVKLNVGIAMGCKQNSWLQFLEGPWDFLRHSIPIGSADHAASYPPDTSLCPHPLSSYNINNGGVNIHPFSPHAFMSQCLTQNKDSFNFNFTLCFSVQLNLLQSSNGISTCKEEYKT